MSFANLASEGHVDTGNIQPTLSGVKGNKVGALEDAVVQLL